MKRTSLTKWLVAALLSTAVVSPVLAQDAPKDDAAASTAIELKDPVATVNGEPITKAELEEAFNQAVQGVGMNPANLSPEQKLAGYRQILQDMVTEKLVSEAAKNETVSDEEVDAEIKTVKAQFPNEEAFQEQLKKSDNTEESLRKLIKSGLQQKKWIESQVAEKTKVTDEEAKKFYDENSAEFEQPEMVRASHILIMVPEDASEEVKKEKEEAAKKAAERAKEKGADFAALAKELSEDPGSKEQGGDLDFFAKETMVPEFGDAAFSMEVDEISDPVKSDFGYHIIKVTGKKEAGKLSFDEVKPKLIEFLKTQKGQAEVGQVLEKLRENAKITINLPEPPAAPDASPAASPAKTDEAAEKPAATN